MQKIELNRVDEIKRLHSEILNSLRMSLEKAMKIGELLTEQKENLKHGEFAAWVNDNLPFTDRTARNYMRVYQERDRLKTETVSDLTDAYQRLIEHRPKIETECKTKWINWKGEQQDYNEETRKYIFDLDVEWLRYQFPLETPDEIIFEGLKERFGKRERENKIPNVFSREIYESIKFATLKEIEYQVKRFELKCDEFIKDYSGESFFDDEHKAKSLKQRWAYMCFMNYMLMFGEHKEENVKKIIGKFIMHYRAMYEGTEEN